MFNNRSTIDIIVLTFTFVVSFVLIVMVTGAVIGRIFRPDLDVSGVVESSKETINTLVGALIGFIGGRAIGKMEAVNGGGNK
jgi:hypothetical protein